MSPAAETLRALADACDECGRIAGMAAVRDRYCIIAQRRALMAALPDVGRWPATAAALRAMADEVEALGAGRGGP